MEIEDLTLASIDVQHLALSEETAATVAIEDLTLESIDVQRLAPSEEIIAAVAFVTRNAWSDKGALRFVTALMMTGNLTADRCEWYATMRKILQLTMDRE